MYIFSFHLDDVEKLGKKHLLSLPTEEDKRKRMYQHDLVFGINRNRLNKR